MTCKARLVAEHDEFVINMHVTQNGCNGTQA